MTGGDALRAPRRLLLGDPSHIAAGAIQFVGERPVPAAPWRRLSLLLSEGMQFAGRVCGTTSYLKISGRPRTSLRLAQDRRDDHAETTPRDLLSNAATESDSLRSIPKGCVSSRGLAGCYGRPVTNCHLRFAFEKCRKGGAKLPGKGPCLK